MLDVVCWLWRPHPRYRSKFSPAHVNVLRRMVARHYQRPHRFSVITDQVDGFDEGIRVIPLWADHAGLVSTYGVTQPSCYRRLKSFSPAMATVIGPRFVSLDLDCVLVDDVAPLWDRPEDFIIWGATGRRTPYNASMWLTTAGARSSVWYRFNADPHAAICAARRAGMYGSDQAWINFHLGRGEACWNEGDGVYSYRMHVQRRAGVLPRGARVVMFEGSQDPDHWKVRSTCPWVLEHYR